MPLAFLGDQHAIAISLLFKKTAPALINDAPDALCDGRQNPGEFKLNPDLSVLDIHEAARCLSRHAHSKVEPVPGPYPAINRHQPSERRDHLIDARFHSTPRLCSAKPMRNGNDDRVGHNLPFVFEVSLRKIMWSARLELQGARPHARSHEAAGLPFHPIPILSCAGPTDEPADRAIRQHNIGHHVGFFDAGVSVKADGFIGGRGRLQL